MKAKIDSILNYDIALTPRVRSMTGAFYTPLSLAFSMIEDATRIYLTNLGYHKTEALSFMAGKVKPTNAESILDKLCRLNFIDMACGTGVFGFAWLIKLAEWQRSYQLDNVATLLKRAMQGMVLNDINATSVAQFNDLIKQHFGCSFYGTLLACDALLELTDEPRVKQIVAKGGFDIIIGNPPYIGERGHTALFASLKNNVTWSQYYQGKMDYSYFFIHQSLNLLSKRGVVTQITTSYFTTADGAIKLRDDIKRRADWRLIRYYDELNVFKNVNNLSFIIFSLSSKTQPKTICDVQRNSDFFETDNQMLYSDKGDIHLVPPDYVNALKKIENNCQLKISDVLAINQGIVSGADRFKRHHCKIIKKPFRKEKPIFVFQDNEINEDEHLKPLLKNSDIKKYKLAKLPSKRILYSAKGNLKNNKKWQRHLRLYRPLLERRREVKTGARAWYELQWPRDEKMFLGAKIITPQRSASNTFAYVEAPFYGSADIYFLTVKPVRMFLNYDDKLVLKGLTMYLNSKVVEQWLMYKGKRKGKLLELYATPLKNIPLPNFSSEDIALLAHYYDEYIATNKKIIIDKCEAIIKIYIDDN